MENIKLSEINIKDLIYEIRGKQVMLDSDVALLYGYETKKINQTVKRNTERFPNNFYFRLTNNEYDELNSLKSQNVTSSWNEIKLRGGRRYLPYVFTEQGIAMLSGLLKNEIAIQVSINIINAFVEMRKFISNNANILNRLTTVEYKLLEYDEKFDMLFDEFNKQDIINEKIFFEGQIYDAYSLLIDLIESAKEKIVIIDNYVDKLY